MQPAHSWLGAAALSGNAAGLLSAATLSLCGLGQAAPAAPLNAVSHWLWPRRALHARQASARYTLAGLAIHQGASLFWALLYEHWCRDVSASGPLARRAAAVALAAMIVDLRLTPRRFTPGFEHRLPPWQLAAVYGSFAGGLLLGARLARC